MVKEDLSPFHQAAGGGLDATFGAYGNVYSCTLPQVGQVTLAFSSICSLLCSAIPCRKAVNVGPQSLQRSSIFSSLIFSLENHAFIRLGLFVSRDATIALGGH